MPEDKVFGDTILVVDDDPTNLDVLFTSLSSAGYRVLVANNGESALTQTEMAVPDIILLDIMMPGMDGFETCREFKKRPKTAEIPIIFITALSDVDSKVRGFEAGGVDYITKPIQEKELLSRIRIHLTLRYQKQELDRLVRDKDRFFSILAHDLKNPMVTFLTGTEMLAENVDLGKNRVRELAGHLHQTAEGLYQLLENLLEWARLQTGGIEPKIGRCNVKTAVEKASDSLISSFTEKALTFEDHTDPGHVVTADRNMLQTVLRNLLSNAWKFTPRQGNVAVFSEPAEDGGKVRISVRDTGIGMTEEKIAALFRIDVKRRTAGTEGEAGTGLGLILTKELIERQGGTVGVESAPGEGTRFTVMLPAAGVSKERNGEPEIT
jgi:signal transduction histidine kinase